MSKWEEEKVNLEQLFTSGKSYEEIGRIYGCTGANIKKVLKSLGFELPQRRKINESEVFTGRNKEQTECPNCGEMFTARSNGRRGLVETCSQTCAAELRAKRSYESYKLDNSIAYGQKNMQSYKKWFIEEQDHKCSICGMLDVWNNKPIMFILDHIDGNADNNQRENLRLVCPNCDSQLDTFKSKNKNSARSKYRQTLKVEDCQ